MKNEYTVSKDKVYIEMTQGKVAVIDKGDMGLVGSFRWCPNPDRKKYRVMTNIVKENNKRGKLYIHQLLMNPPKGMVVDHIDGDPLNNVRSNLRICTLHQNSMNRLSRPNSTSDYLGVSWKKKNKK